MTAAAVVGLLVAGGVHLVLQSSLVRVVLGAILLGHAVNVLLLASGGMDRRGMPLGRGTPSSQLADPLPQAFVLTAIVITFSITVFLLALARAGGPHADDGGETDDGAEAAEAEAPGD